MDLQYPCCQEPDILQAHRLLHPSLPQFPHGLENGLIPGEWDDSLDCEDVRSPGNLYTQRRSNRESQKSIPILSKKSATVDFSILGSVCTNFLGKGSCQVKSYKVELTRLGRRVAELGSPEHQMYANVSSKTGRISIWTELKRSTMSTMTPEL